jgi:putative ABC transport system permease protein
MSLWQDLRFAVRLLVKDKWYTAVAAIALALGIGVNATVFTFVNAVILRGLPFEEPDRIISVFTRDARNRDRGVSYPDFLDWRTSTRTFSGLTAYAGATMNVSDEGKAPERFQGPYISTNAFSLIGERPFMGRDFLPEDGRIGAPPVVLLGNGIFKNRYGADASIIGRVVRVNDIAATVIGVMPEGFKFPTNADLWLPLEQMPRLTEQKRDARTLEVFGRLASGATLEQARSEFDAIGSNLARDNPTTNKDVKAVVLPFNDRVNGGPIRLVFLSLMGAVAFVLLIACANVANLLLARSASRAREMSVRVSLGASRWRIVRQLLVESVLLSVISGLLGLALANVGVRLFDAATQDVGKPYWIQFTMDASVFAFFAAICLGTGIVFGLAPALHVSKTDINEVLKEGGGRSGASGGRARRWTSALIVAELALTLVLLAGAGLMIRSFLTLYSLDVGVETAHLLTMRLALPDQKYPTLEQRRAFYDRLDQRLAGLPGVEAATMTSSMPLQGGAARLLEIDGQAAPAGEQAPTVTQITIGSRYFETMGLNLAQGRLFDGLDGTPGHENAIVNQRFVEMHLGNDPLGRRIKLTSEGPAPPGTPEPTWLTVVGVSPTIRQRNVQDALPDPVVYVPLRAQSPASAMLAIRAQGDAASLTTLMREEVKGIDPDLPLFGIETMDRALSQSRWPYRVFGSMFGIFAFIALALSAVGLYAVTAYSVAQRTQEIGVRMALGAQAPQVWWLILRGSLVQLAIGLVLGLAGAFGVGKLLESLLVQTGSGDPATLVSIAALLLAVSMGACFFPARRATRLDPVSALRDE